MTLVRCSQPLRTIVKEIYLSCACIHKNGKNTPRGREKH